MTPKDVKLGATGKFPDGKLGPEDEGELQLALVADHDKRVIAFIFGKPVGWLALPPALARTLAAALIEKADELEARVQ